MYDRRVFVRALAILVAVAPTVPLAQRAERLRRIGVLSPGPTLAPSEYQAVWSPLSDLGWVEGQNVLFERRWAEGRPERLRLLADELVRLNVDVITTIGKDAAVAAKAATSRIPIVMLAVDDPVASGLVASLAHPGGNVTGVSMVAPELDAKRLALLQELVPGLERVGVLVDPTTSIAGFSREESDRAYRVLGIQPIFVEVASAADLEDAIAQVARRGGQGVVVHNDVLFVRNATLVMNAVLKNRLPAAVEGRGMLEAGGLLSYTNDARDQFKRIAVLVDKILRGANPSDLPVEQPTNFKLAINLNTARRLGLTIPPSMLLRADEVIQ